LTRRKVTPGNLPQRTPDDFMRCPHKSVSKFDPDREMARNTYMLTTIQTRATPVYADAALHT